MIPPINKVLYATDLGEHTRPVFRRAVSLARRYNALLLMVHVVEPLGTAGSAIVETYLPAETADKVLKNGGMHDVLEKMKKRVQLFAEEELAAESAERIPDTEVHVTLGTPSRELLRIAEENDVDVIVIGKSAHSFFGNTMMGTCARRVTRYSNIPVFLVPNND
ncbi:universal stress protein [Desulfogranum marinum]|uniref:universal stress protein n=1 Tax=Desulfogranum marinum TaxID=453220 RepID=UPI001965D5CE|nr:universal stress protein [Desulfogranum marinum]MBM9510771.1 universal stress protein [Desulfogranum marinum]